jgi:hypothetical protein
MDWMTEVYVQLNDDGAPMAMSAETICKRILHTRNKPSMGDYRSVCYALQKLSENGEASCRRVDGSDQKFEWFSREKIKSIIYGSHD